LAEFPQAIFLIAIPGHFVLGPVVLRIPFEVAEIADSFTVDGRGSAAIARQLQRLGHRLVNGEEIETVSLEHRNAESLDALDDIITADAVVGAGMLAVAV